MLFRSNVLPEDEVEAPLPGSTLALARNERERAWADMALKNAEIALRANEGVVVALHPGTVATRFTLDYQASHPTVTPQVAAAGLVKVLDGLTPAQSGGFYDARGKQILW